MFSRARTAATTKSGARPSNMPSTRSSPSDADGNDDDRQSGGRLVACTFTVFAAEQADGTSGLVDTARRVNRDSPVRVDSAGGFFAAIGARVQIGSNSACYELSAGTIRLPALNPFDQAAHFDATQAHERIHWTGVTAAALPATCRAASGPTRAPPRN